MSIAYNILSNKILFQYLKWSVVLLWLKIPRIKWICKYNNSACFWHGLLSGSAPTKTLSNGRLRYGFKFSNLKLRFTLTPFSFMKWFLNIWSTYRAWIHCRFYGSNEALQGLLATSDIALIPGNRQPTEPDQKKMTNCDSDNQFSI